MDDRMVLLRKSQKVDQQLSERPSSAIKSRKQKLDAMARKMKLIKSDIENMQRILDNSYKVDSVVDKENRFKEVQMILGQQEIKLRDYKKVIREQKKFMREVEHMENAGGKLDGINKHFTESKDRMRELKKQYTEEDKRLRDQHQEVQTMKERVRKIRDYIQEKKRIESETGVKQDVTEADIDKLHTKIEELENERKEVGRCIGCLILKFRKTVESQAATTRGPLKTHPT